MMRLHCLFFFLLLSVTFAASDVLHESCNRTRFPALCVKFLRFWPEPDQHSLGRFWPNPNQRSLALHSFHQSILTGHATVYFANIYLENDRKNGGRKSIEDSRLFDCLAECAYAVNVSVSTVRQAKAALDVDLDKAIELTRDAISFVAGAGCVKQGGPALEWIDKNDKKYTKLLRITLDLLGLIKK